MANSKPKFELTDERRRLCAAIVRRWAELRPDLACDPVALRDARVEWVRAELGLRSLDSLKSLSDRQLKLTLVRMRNPRQRSNQQNVVRFPGAPSIPQVNAIVRVIGHLEWSEADAATWLRKRYGVDSPCRLPLKNANTALYLLLRIAASRLLRTEVDASRTWSKSEINQTIPLVKERLGIETGDSNARI